MWVRDEDVDALLRGDTDKTVSLVRASSDFARAVLAAVSGTAALPSERSLFERMGETIRSADRRRDVVVISAAEMKDGEVDRARPRPFCLWRGRFDLEENARIEHALLFAAMCDVTIESIVSSTPSSTAVFPPE